MTRRSLNLTDRSMTICARFGCASRRYLRALREETGRMPLANIQSAPEPGLLVELICARLCLEIGTFTGYSTLWIAQAMPPDGHLVCCDIDADTIAIARRYWQMAGLADRIELPSAPPAGRSPRWSANTRPAVSISPSSTPTGPFRTAISSR